jgi:hypothetical protein
MTEAAVRLAGPHAEARLTGRDGMPWPEFWRGLPALVVPQLPGLLRPLDPAHGWSGDPQTAAGPVHPHWLLTLTGRQLTITGPGPLTWFDGHPLLTREWMRAARARHQVLLISGPFPSIDQFAATAAGGALQLLLLGVR